jgi:exopolysaccharide production protein ExoQ
MLGNLVNVDPSIAAYSPDTFMNKLLILSEKIFTIVSLIHYAGSPFFVILSGGISEGEFPDTTPDIPFINQVFLIIYVIAFCLLLFRWKKVLPVILKSSLVWLLLGFAILSISWSYSPDLTKTRVIALIGTMMFSLYFSSRYSLKEQLQLLGWLFRIVIIASIIFAVALPKYGIMSGVHSGAWRGIYNHKNVLGKNMVISVVVFLLLALKTKERRWILWSFLSASIGLIILSRSSSPLVNLLILMNIFLMLCVFRWKYIFMVPSLVGILSVSTILYLLLTANAEQIASSFGKDLTLTGRTNFWPLVIDSIWHKPWLGYGFGAFWQGLDGPSAYVWNASSFKTPNGHNGYLDLCLELGFVGLGIYMVQFFKSVTSGIAYIMRVRTSDAFWPILLLSYIVLSNLTESSLVVQNNFLWTLQLSVFFSLSMPQAGKMTDPVLEKI